MSQQEYLTSEKKLELENELANLKNVRRKEIADALEWSKGLGDLSENAEYSQAREDQGKCESRISELEEILQNAIIKDEHHTKGGIEVGSTVAVKKAGESKEKIFTIVGSEEVNLEEGKISNESPIGAALLGKKEGDTVSVNTPAGKVDYKIVSVK